MRNARRARKQVGDFMSDLNLVAENASPVGSSISAKFLGRLALSMALTAIDIGVLVFVGKVAYQSSLISVALPAAFAILALGMGATLGRMWLLTVQPTGSSKAVESYAQVPLPLQGQPLTRGR